MASSQEEAKTMPLADFEKDINRCQWGAGNGGSSQGRKAYFKRLLWLEQPREILFDIPAPRHYFRQGRS